ncbi:MAG TPA: HDIG domain-containing protein [Chloroflexota bacterium]|nr:HDIG domain-containing protein [Chloroflexota bacterium]
MTSSGHLTLAVPGGLRERLRVLAEAFRAAERDLQLVGGCVRDQLIDRPIHDLDLTTDAPPDEIKRLATSARPDGLYDVGAKFGTIGVICRLPELEQSWTLEITTYRTEQYLDGTRKPVVAFGSSLQEDLARRDFTMNAIAVDALSGELHDPFGGQTDIVAHLIRAVGNPIERFRDDPLRLLRAVRFSAQLGFEIEAGTLAAIQVSAPELQRISRERIAQELTSILVSPRPDVGIRLATDLGLMEHCIPEVLPMRGVSQRPLHHKDVFEHTLGVLRNIQQPDQLLRWSALLHDIAKPQTKSVQNGAVHFFGHEDLGARMARRILRSLHFDNRFIERVARLVQMHLRVNSYDPDWTDSAVRRLVREAAEELEPLVALSRADVTSYRTERRQAAAQRADAFEQRVAELQAQEDIAQLQSPLDGNDLMALFGQKPGPWIRPIKDYLFNLVLEGDLTQDDRETATRLAKEYAAVHGLP